MTTLEQFYEYTPEQLDIIINGRYPTQNINEKRYAAMYFSYPNVNDELKSYLIQPQFIDYVKISGSPQELRYNILPIRDKIIYVLNQLFIRYSQTGDIHRAKAFSKARDAFQLYSGEMTEKALTKIPGIGKSSAEVIMEVYTTGKSTRLQNPITPLPTPTPSPKKSPQKTEKDIIIDLFTSVHGIGEKSAEQFYNAGYRTLEQLKNSNLLNPSQLLGLQYRDYLVQKIPRSEIDQWVQLLTQMFGNPPEIGPNLWAIGGSYRRGEPESSDFDLIVSDYSIQDTINAMGSYVIGNFTPNAVRTARIIVKLPNSIPRQMDITTYPRQSFHYGLYHVTGSADFLILAAMRAKQFGATLNWDSLIDSNGVSYPANSERDIFYYLRLKYLKPEERLRTLTRLETIE